MPVSEGKHTVALLLGSTLKFPTLETPEGRWFTWLTYVVFINHCIFLALCQYFFKFESIERKTTGSVQTKPKDFCITLIIVASNHNKL